MMTAIKLLLSKSWLLFVVVVAASGIGGGAYAAWTASLHVEGTIQTGNVDVVWDMQKENEFVGVLDPATGQLVNQPVPTEKDVSICLSDLETGQTASTVNFQLLNAYPSYTCQITLGGLVTGSVPVHVSDIQRKILDAAGNDVLDTELNMGVQLTRKLDIGDGLFRCDTAQPVTTGTQLHRGDRFCAIIDVHATEAAQQTHTYTGSLWIDLIQWNFAGQSAPVVLPDLVVQLTNVPTDVVCELIDDVVLCNAAVEFDVTNVGPADAVGNFDVELVADQVPALVVPVAGPLGSGVTRSFTITTDMGGNCYDPDCTVVVTADSGNVIPEGNESNNTDTRTDIG